MEIYRTVYFFTFSNIYIGIYNISYPKILKKQGKPLFRLEGSWQIFKWSQFLLSACKQFYYQHFYYTEKCTCSFILILMN